MIRVAVKGAAFLAQVAKRQEEFNGFPIDEVGGGGGLFST